MANYYHEARSVVKGMKEREASNRRRAERRAEIETAKVRCFPEASVWPAVPAKTHHAEGGLRHSGLRRSIFTLLFSRTVPGQPLLSGTAVGQAGCLHPCTQRMALGSCVAHHLVRRGQHFALSQFE